MTVANDAKERAEASFKKKALRVRESSQAMADYEAAGRAVRLKTERLRSLRLAKEVDDLVAVTIAEPAKKPTRAARSTLRSSSAGRPARVDPDAAVLRKAH